MPSPGSMKPARHDHIVGAKRGERCPTPRRANREAERGAKPGRRDRVDGSWSQTALLTSAHEQRRRGGSTEHEGSDPLRPADLVAGDHYGVGLAQLGRIDLAESLHSVDVESRARRVRDARHAIAQQGRKFLGAKAVLQQRFDATPKTSELRRNANPRIAAAHTPERVQAIRNLLAFLRDYRAAWHAWRHGKRDQVFPAGTYALRIHARVACAPACPA